MFLNVFLTYASQTIQSNEHVQAASLYKDLGESWYEAEKALAGMTTADGAHVPIEGSTLGADVKLAVEDSLKLLWEALVPKLRVR